jgi:hypothetical protein
MAGATEWAYIRTPPSHRSRIQMRIARLFSFVTMLWVCCSSALGQGIVYNGTTGILTIPSVSVGSNTYINVTLLNTGNFIFTLQGATLQVPPQAAVASYNGTTSVLTLPSVTVGAKTYAVTMLNTGNFRFSLLTAIEIQTFLYFSKNSSIGKTATLSNGTLSMDGLSITNFRFGSSASDASGTLTQWASPWNNYNQPVVPAMLFCGTDGKLSYVLIASTANEPDRITANAQQLVDAVHSASQYDGVSIYRTCGGSFSDKWLNNLPASTYILWSNIFAPVDYALVTNQLDGGVIYKKLGTPSNFHNYLAITWRGGSGNTFEVWQ